MKNTPRIALITGSGRGIGRATAETLGKQGATLVIADIDAALAERTAGEFRKDGLAASALEVDISSEASVTAAYKEVDRLYGRLDVLVNNAAVLGLQDGERVLIEHMTLATWEQALRVNLTGTFLMCRGALPLMRRNHYGRIVNISSRAARMNVRLPIANYAASKSGLLGFSRMLAFEVGGDGITVNCVAPGRITTDMTISANGGGEYVTKMAAETVVGRIGVPADIANAVAFLSSEQASFITGIVVDVMGGQHMP